MFEGILVDIPFATFFLSKLKQKYVNLISTSISCHFIRFLSPHRLFEHVVKLLLFFG